MILVLRNLYSLNLFKNFDPFDHFEINRKKNFLVVNKAFWCCGDDCLCCSDPCATQECFIFLVLEHPKVLVVETGRETPNFIGNPRPFSLAGIPDVSGGWSYGGALCFLKTVFYC